jgi:hypothetical protein
MQLLQVVPVLQSAEQVGTLPICEMLEMSPQKTSEMRKEKGSRKVLSKNIQGEELKLPWRDLKSVAIQGGRIQENNLPT